MTDFVLFCGHADKHRHDCAPRTEVVLAQCHLQEELYESRLKQAACDQALNRSPIAALKVWVVATRLALHCRCHSPCKRVSTWCCRLFASACHGGNCQIDLKPG